MIVKLNDDEIREILSEAIAEKLGEAVDAESCWFECEAG